MLMTLRSLEVFFSARCPGSNYWGFQQGGKAGIVEKGTAPPDSVNWWVVLSAAQAGSPESLECVWESPRDWSYQQILIKSLKLSAVIHFLWSLIPCPSSDLDHQKIPIHTHMDTPACTQKNINGAHCHILLTNALVLSLTQLQSDCMLPH